LDPDTAIGGPNGAFPSTRHSLLDRAAAGLGNEALERVTALYWKPVYRFLRWKFHKDNEDAKDLTQGFFVSALERDFFTRFDPAKGTFRTYLRMAVERFAAGVHAAGRRQKRGGDVEFEPIGEELAATDSPEEAFDREWRRQLFTLALDDLRRFAEGAGKQVQWGVFEAYDLAQGERPSYADLAARFGIAETSVTNYLAWARRTLRGLVEERLRGVTSGEGELREEIRRLWT
jgi:RNA polymerase sigma factor (sigma-70 family)